MEVDIENNKFGVEFASFDFMTDIIQSTRNIKLPVGAGAYKCTDTSNSDTPSESNFYINNVVYFKANDQFTTVGEGIENAKIDKIRYQIVSSNNAIAALQDGTVHYISPALTTDNYEKLEALKSKGMVTLTTDQLGYGYIGLNAAKINDINIRKAIMCAMNTGLALDYYRAGTASQIYWPMSKISWAYPDGPEATDNGFDYPQLGTWNEEVAVANIEKYMREAGVSEGDSELKAIRLKNTETNEESRLEVDGIFLAIGTEPENGAYAKVSELNDFGYIVADERCLTKTEGIYVAGDCRTKAYRQVATAVADGATAALSACRYLDQ